MLKISVITLCKNNEATIADAIFDYVKNHSSIIHVYSIFDNAGVVIEKQTAQIKLTLFVPPHKILVGTSCGVGSTRTELTLVFYGSEVLAQVNLRGKIVGLERCAVHRSVDVGSGSLVTAQTNY